MNNLLRNINSCWGLEPTEMIPSLMRNIIYLRVSVWRTLFLYETGASRAQVNGSITYSSAAGIHHREGRIEDWWVGKLLGLFPVVGSKAQVESLTSS